MTNKKTLVNSIVLQRFIDNYSEQEYTVAWQKLQKFLTDNKNNQDLYRESAYDAEWLNEIFCEILGYPKKLKSREYHTTNGSGKKEERVDGIFYHKDSENVRIVVELKALDTTDLFKKDGKLSPITQCAKYLFQTPHSELAVVSNFDQLVVFDRKEEFRQSWSLFKMRYEDFKEFYLVLCFDSVYGNLTKLMIEQSVHSEKDVDDEFYSLIASIHKSLHNRFKQEYASDLFNKFLAMAVLEDSAKLPPQLIQTVFNRKVDFDQNLKAHWDVFVTFFKTMKNNKSSREYLKIDENVAKLNVWDDISYLGRIKVPKSILDQVLALSEYNLKSVSLHELFFGITKRIYNPYDGIGFYQDEYQKQFYFYSTVLLENYTPVDLCLAFACGKYVDISHPIIKLFNQLCVDKKITSSDSAEFSIDLDYCGKSDCTTIISVVDLDDFNVVKSITQSVDDIKVLQHDTDYVILKCSKNPKETFTYQTEYGVEYFKRSDVKRKIRLKTPQEKSWLENYIKNAKPLNQFGATVNKNKTDDTCFELNLTKGKVKYIGKNATTLNTEQFCEEDDVKVFFKPKTQNMDLILSSPDFIKYVNLMDMIDLDNAVVSTHLMSHDFLKSALKIKEVKENIRLFEYKLGKLITHGGDETEIIRVEMKLDDFYAQEKELCE